MHTAGKEVGFLLDKPVAVGPCSAREVGVPGRGLAWKWSVPVPLSKPRLSNGSGR
jgi:hypothetical protein